MILAGDVGGTKVNLALFRVEGGRLWPHASETFPSREHQSLESVLHVFLGRHPAKPVHASFGIAGPVKNGRSLLTNLRWTIDAAAVAGAFGLQQVSLMNDLQANAYGIAALPPEDFVTLNAGEAVADGNQAIISAGTGLGESGIITSGGRQIAIASEGGNAEFSPRTDLDVELFRWLRAQYGQVIWEHVLCGNGQVNIYNFLRAAGHGREESWLTAEFQAGDLPPAAVITRAALAGKSPLAAQALDLFVTYYGMEAANLALKFLATGGVFIGGGIAPKIITKLQDGTFLRAFAGVSRYTPLLQAMPVRVIMNDKTALLGAARFAAVQAGLVA